MHPSTWKCNNAFKRQVSLLDMSNVSIRYVKPCARYPSSPATSEIRERNRQSHVNKEAALRLGTRLALCLPRFHSQCNRRFENMRAAVRLLLELEIVHVGNSFVKYWGASSLAGTLRTCEALQIIIFNVSSIKFKCLKRARKV